MCRIWLRQAPTKIAVAGATGRDDSLDVTSRGDDVGIETVDDPTDPDTALDQTGVLLSMLTTHGAA